jgi:vacuolar-type H+-ATPase subunit F/Vma7
MERTDSISVIGSPELLTGFKLAGVSSLHPVVNAAEGEALLAKLMNEPNIGILIVEDKLLESCDWRLKKKVEAAAKPVVVAVPSRAGPMEQSESLAKLVKRALGFDISRNSGKKE